MNDGWREAAGSRLHIVDHLVVQFDLGKARIRLCDHSATLTIKGLRRGFTRSEYHLSLSNADARSMVEEFAKGPGLEKWRHEVVMQGLVWQVDEYTGPLIGLVTADVELPAEDHPLPIPDWVGREITGDPRYSSAQLASVARANETAAGIDCP
ncbi:putative triphosphate tunnel metalloenzyme (CYTH-like) [Rhizobium mesoamericanum STM3625]|uniref:Putative triphosphate tunnel metalloenzyme (CYTH-like) n=2 Tax=Rhizobium mesoamericanum TaxID=1079800 RepID=K0Q688_9HYPH|nr:putative triphosphate tunnel metalloenzyme (CYTH-like) [Rhizobium mesoamericanum STM3625]